MIRIGAIGSCALGSDMPFSGQMKLLFTRQFDGLDLDAELRFAINPKFQCAVKGRWSTVGESPTRELVRSTR